MDERSGTRPDHPPSRPVTTRTVWEGREYPDSQIWSMVITTGLTSDVLPKTKTDVP